MPIGAKTFEDFWAIETKPGQDVAEIQARLTQTIQSLPAGERTDAILIARVVTSVGIAMRKVAWMAWLDGRLGADEQQAHRRHEIDQLLQRVERLECRQEIRQPLTFEGKPELLGARKHHAAK